MTMSVSRRSILRCISFAASIASSTPEDSNACVTYGQHYVWPRFRAQVLAAISVIQVCVGRLDDQLSPVGHCVPRIDRQVHEHLAQLPGIRFDAPKAGFQPDRKLDIFSNHAMEHLFNFHDRSIEVNDCWFDDLLAAECE